MRTKNQIALFLLLLIVIFIGLAAVERFLASRHAVSPFSQARGIPPASLGAENIEAYRPGEVPYEETRQFTGPPPPQKIRSYVKGG